MRSFAELADTLFAGALNALCWPRELEGDFGEVARCFADRSGITSLDAEMLASLPLSPAGRRAADAMIADLTMLADLGLQPELNVINGYPDEDDGPMPRDVMSWHVDSATEEADTWLCTYYGPSSEALLNEHAMPRASIPEMRTALLALYGGPDDPGFAEFLSENSYDLHYTALPGATPVVFGTGNLWRVTTEYPGSPVLPCIHRAPRTGPGELRLLLIS